RLFLPESWTSKRSRLERAGVPAECRTARTKPEMALAEIDRAIAAGVRFGCVLADAGYGLSAPFRQGLTARRLAWAVGIPRHSGAISRSSFLIGELLLGKLSETVVVVGNAPHDRPGFLVGHLIGNRASFLCTKAPMPRIPVTNFLHGIRSISGRDVQAIFRRRRHQPSRPPPARIRPRQSSTGDGAGDGDCGD